MRRIYLISPAVVLLVGLISGCGATTSMMRLTTEETTYLAKVNAHPLEFTIPKSEDADAWGRAQSFIGRFSSMKLQTVTDYVIQTFNPSESDVSYGYYVTKTPLGDEIQYTIQCNCGNMFGGADANQNGRILAYYISSGELPYPRLIMK
ncbi:hypothetical protein ACFL3X_01930 [Gemmatimonadota bacterium]